MRVSELITIDEINNWSQGDIITIKAGTGQGKSYFIKNNLHAIAKRDQTKILFLLHRTNTVNQFQDEIINDNKQDVIHIKTYQSIETAIKNNKTVDFTPYKYIVADEFHYFMSDAAFNHTTDISLNTILNQSHSIRIFMSATGDHMKGYISKYRKLHTINYELPIDYNFIRSLTFYHKDSTLDDFVQDAIRTNEKMVIFIQHAQDAYDLHQKYKDISLFNCSKSNKLYKYVDSDKISQMLSNEKFSELILITTTSLDAGVNLRDSQLKHIICDVKDIETIIQCIGRKRLSKHDNELNVYIRSIGNKTLGGIKSRLKNRVDKSDFLFKHGETSYINKYGRDLDYSKIVYDSLDENGNPTKKVNELMYFKSKFDIATIDAMLYRKKYGFNKHIGEMFGFYDSETNDYRYVLLEEEQQTMNLKEYLESIVGKRLLKDKQKELIEYISLKDSRGRVQKSINMLNLYLKENKFNYLIVSKRTSERVDGKVKSIRYWEIISNVEN